MFKQIFLSEFVYVVDKIPQKDFTSAFGLSRVLPKAALNFAYDFSQALSVSVSLAHPGDV